jgi:dTDP-glucose pyrophosphorylase
MKNWEQIIINASATILQAMQQLDNVGFEDGVLFINDDHGNYIGSLTDGDIRRALLKGQSTSTSVVEICNKNSKIINANTLITDELLNKFIADNINLIPIIEHHRIIDIKFINEIKNKIKVDVFILAGGKGERLLPLTKDTPKPMLHIGSKPIIEHNIDSLIQSGVENITISVNYLKEKITDYFKDGAHKGISINYVEENTPLGTLGSITLAPEFKKDDVLILNSDLLTTIDYAEFYKEFKTTNADVMVASIPYKVDIPYAIFTSQQNYDILNLEEKPTYTYYANAGIYMVKKSLLASIPYNTFFNATDLLSLAIEKKLTVKHFPILNYWLDIGKMNDFNKAQEDIKHLKF